MNGFNALLGMTMVGVRQDGYIIELDVGPQHLHDAGRVHGGVYLSLLDTVMSRAIRSTLDDESYVPTLAINANFFRPMADGRITAIGKVLNQSRSVCYVEGRLLNDVGKLLAQGNGTLFFAGRV